VAGQFESDQISSRTDIYLLICSVLTSPPVKERSIATRMSLCVSVSASISLELHCSLHQIFVHVNYCLVSVLWWRCDALFIFGFTDAVVFAHKWPGICYARKAYTQNDSPGAA